MESGLKAMNVALAKSWLKDHLETVIGLRKIYVMIKPTKTNKKEVQFFCVVNDNIRNTTREIGIVTGRKFTKDNRALIVTDVEMVLEDLSQELVCDKFELVRL
jgi:hypothetical protein